MCRRDSLYPEKGGRNSSVQEVSGAPLTAHVPPPSKPGDGAGSTAIAVATIDGFADARFSAAREAFEANFADGEELGASFCATIDGETVVDLWGGCSSLRVILL